MRRLHIIACLSLIAAGCGVGPEAYPEVTADLPTVLAEAVQTWEFDAVLPTDVIALDDGGFLVLDSGAATILSFPPGAQSPTKEARSPVWGQPVRITPRDGGGYWLSDPGSAHRDGVVYGVDAEWLTVEALAPPREHELEDGEVPDEAPAPFAPVAVVDPGAPAALVVGDRYGRIFWLDRETGEVTRKLSLDADELPFGSITDMVLSSEGSILAIDTLGPRLHEISTDGRAGHSFGRFGPWAGNFEKPKAVAETAAGEPLIVDTATGVAQLFDRRGRLLGVVAGEAGAIHWEHPIAVRTAGEPDAFFVLDASARTVTRLRLEAASLGAARERAGGRMHRTLRTLIDTGGLAAAGDNGARCKQCHDGLVNPGWRGWDNGKEHHPVGIVPEKEVPAFFPVDDQGRLTCATCHSPHGVVTAEEAAGIEDSDQIRLLVRHRSPGTAFLRLTVEDSALCAGCHGDAAHEETVSGMALLGESHPVGGALKEALAKRVEGGRSQSSEEGSCLVCHAPHGAADSNLMRSSDDDTGCIACHEDRSNPRSNHALGQKVGRDHGRTSSDLVTDNTGGVLCRSCHDLVTGRQGALLRRPPGGKILCLACHDERKDLIASAHKRVNGDRGIPCLGCHDIHGGDAKDRFLSTREHASDGDPTGCLSCHGSGKKSAKRGIDPGGLGHPLTGAIEGTPEIEGCPTCHDAHRTDVPPSSDCLECHEDQAAAELRGGHGEARCRDCHPAHSETVSANAPDSNPYSRRCLSCHRSDAKGDAPKVAGYEHPAPVFLPDGRRWQPLETLRLFAKDGTRLPPGTNGELTCGSCHLTHGPHREQPASKLRLPDWEDACSSCHGPRSLPLYLYFHQPGRRAKSSEEGP